VRVGRNEMKELGGGKREGGEKEVWTRMMGRRIKIGG